MKVIKIVGIVLLIAAAGTGIFFWMQYEKSQDMEHKIANLGSQKYSSLNVDDAVPADLVKQIKNQKNFRIMISMFNKDRKLAEKKMDLFYKKGPDFLRVHINAIYAIAGNSKDKKIALDRISKLVDSNGYAAKFSIYTLSDVLDEEGVKKLIELTEAEKSHKRKEFMYRAIMRNQNLPAATHAIKKALEKGDDHLKASIYKAMETSSYPVTKLKTYLIKDLEHGKPHVMAFLVPNLKRIKPSPEYINMLLAKSSDSRVPVRGAAVEVLLHLKAEIPARNIKHWINDDASSLRRAALILIAKENINSDGKKQDYFDMIYSRLTDKDDKVVYRAGETMVTFFKNAQPKRERREGIDEFHKREMLFEKWQRNIMKEKLPKIINSDRLEVIKAGLSSIKAFGRYKSHKKHGMAYLDDLTTMVEFVKKHLRDEKMGKVILQLARDTMKEIFGVLATQLKKYDIYTLTSESEWNKFHSRASFIAGIWSEYAKIDKEYGKLMADINQRKDTELIKKVKEKITPLLAKVRELTRKVSKAEDYCAKGSQLKKTMEKLNEEVGTSQYTLNKNATIK